jgi:hypothetical protein
MRRRFHEDLERIGLRARRQHDACRTFISITRADGARADILRWATHGPTGDIVDDYTTLPWPALCEEVAKVRISLLEGKLIEFPIAATGTDGPAVTAEPADPSNPRYTTRYSSGTDRNDITFWRSGRDLNPTEMMPNDQESAWPCKYLGRLARVLVRTRLAWSDGIG